MAFYDITSMSGDDIISETTGREEAFKSFKASITALLNACESSNSATINTKRTQKPM